MPDTIAVDFETYYCAKTKYSLRNQLPDWYCAHDLFDPYLISVSDGTQCWAGSPKDFNWSALEGKILLSHNSAFDSSVYHAMVKRGWAPEVKYKDWLCTANMTAYLANRRALDSAVEYFYKVVLSKESRSNADGKHWPADFSPAEQTAMLEYARRDAYWCWKLFNDHGSKWPEIERRLSAFTIAQGRRGVCIDRELLDTAILTAFDMRQATEKVIPWIAGAEDEEWEEFNTKPTSTKCIAEACRKAGIPCPPVKSREGEDAYLAWEAEYGPRNLWIGAVSSWRSINKLEKTLATMRERIRPDGRMPYALKYFGGHTGRWSGDARLNMQNFPRLPYFQNAQGLLETDDGRIKQAVRQYKTTKTLPDWCRARVDLRNLIIPAPGKKFVIADLSQIEPRVLNWFAGNTELLELVRQGFSVYESHARASMDWTGGKLDEENEGLYALAKARVLGLGYGCGWRKFVVVAKAMAGLDITKDDPEWIETVDPNTGETVKVSGYGTTSKKIVNDFRTANPKIVQVWRDLDDAFKRSIAGDFVMALPSGRSMRYGNVRCEYRILPDPETKKPVKKSVFTADIGGFRYVLYGGLFSENWVQAVSRDLFAYNMLDVETAGYPVVLQAHDEIVAEVDMDCPAKTIGALMTRTPEWMPGLPMASKAADADRYSK